MLFCIFLENDPVAAKMLSYNRANRAVAVLCNHQRAVPKNFSQQMERMADKIASKKKDVKEATRQLKDAKQQAKNSNASSVLRFVHCFNKLSIVNVCDYWCFSASVKAHIFNAAC